MGVILQRQIGPHGGFLCAEEFGCILWVTGKLPTKHDAHADIRVLKMSLAGSCSHALGITYLYYFQDLLDVPGAT